MNCKNNPQQLNIFNVEKQEIDLWLEEKELFSRGFEYVGGIDEAGRGPLAGPVVAAIVVAKKPITIKGIADSKKLTPAKRLTLKTLIENHPDLHIGISIISPSTIDKINILQASLLAFQKAIEDVKIKPDFSILDGNKESPFIKGPQKSIIKGDAKSFLIASASIIAKETRDALMIEYDKKWPEYGFAKHKGYPTKFHQNSIKQFGICEIHRKSFEPVKSYLEQN